MMRLAFVVAAFAAASMHAAESLQAIVDHSVAGSVIDLAPGEYSGPVVITKPVTLRGTGKATVQGDGKSHVIEIKAENVTIDGLVITRSGLKLGKDHAGIFVEGNHATLRGNVIRESLHGIYVKKADDCRVLENRIYGKDQVTVPAETVSIQARPAGAETCEVGLAQDRRGNGIHLWNSQRATISGNFVEGSRDGMYFSFSNQCTVRGNSIRRVRFGLHYMYSDGNVFEDNRFAESDVGSTLMFSRNMVIRGNHFAANVSHRAYGMVLTSVDNSRIENNDFSGNSIGLCLEYSSNNIFARNVLSRSYIGARLTASSDGNRFTRNVLEENMHSVEIDGDISRNAWSDGKAGNRWGRATQVDLNGDGIGDVPHRESDLLGGLRRPFPLSALLSGSPALELIRYAQQHAKIPGVPAVQDPAPLATAFPK